MKILLVQLGRLGDMILQTALISEIYKNFNSPEIHVISGTHNYSILKNNPKVSKIIIFGKSPKKIFSIISNLRNNNYDYLIDPKDHYSRQSELIARITKANLKIGFNKNNKHVFDISIPDENNNIGLHFIERSMNILPLIGLTNPTGIPRPELYPDENSRKFVDSFIKINNLEKLIILNISAGAITRMWQIDKWKRVIQESFNQNQKIILTYMNSEKNDAEYLMNILPNIISFNNNTFDDIIALIQRTSLVITPDTSFVHIASAYDTPIVTLSTGLDNFSKFSPLSSFQRVVKTDENKEDIRDIQVEDVTGAVNSLTQIIH